MNHQMTSLATVVIEAGGGRVDQGDTGALELILRVTDPDLLEELGRYPEGRSRQDFALAALRIGALALRHAQGRIDADLIRNEGERLVHELAHSLGEHQRAVAEQLNGTLREYFDPGSGRLNER